jgi:hypothetical protein
MKSFFGKINLVRNFTSNFVEIVKPMQRMIHKYVEFKWMDEGNKSFKKIKTTISQAHVLCNSDFSNFFYLYTFASDQSLAVVLNQKDDENNEAPICKFQS